jgi:hypothetical protein
MNVSFKLKFGNVRETGGNWVGVITPSEDARGAVELEHHWTGDQSAKCLVETAAAHVPGVNYEEVWQDGKRRYELFAPAPPTAVKEPDLRRKAWHAILVLGVLTQGNPFAKEAMEILTKYHEDSVLAEDDRAWEETGDGEEDEDLAEAIESVL